MNNSNFDDLMKRYLSGKVTEQERVKIEAWLDVKKTEEGEGLELSSEDEAILFRKITSRVEGRESVVSFRPGQEEEAPVKKMHTTRWLRWAASILVVMTVGFSIWRLMNTDGTQRIVAKGAMEKIILQDGTIVWLNAGASLVYTPDARSSERHVTLEGEALFEVAKDATRPFIIQCGFASVRVLGTSFNLNAVDDRVELQVLTGLVNVSSSKDAAGVMVKPNETMVCTAKGERKKGTLALGEIQSINGIEEYRMRFKGELLSEVVARIEHKFDVKVIVGNKAAMGCRVTADFTDQSLEHTLNLLSELLDIEYKIADRTVEITGAGCHQ